MFGLSFGEILIVLVVALLVLGPERLPKVARSLGKGMRDLRRTTGGIREIIEDELYLDETVDRPPARPTEAAEGGPVARGPVHAAPALEASDQPAVKADASSTDEPEAKGESEP